MSGGKLSWEQFDAVNEDRRTAFEDLCRQLFKYTYFDSKTCFHANPSNPGTEIEPLYSEITKNRISYQSKYFDSSVSYQQIKDSVEKIVKYYTGQIDVVYLYCNCKINTATKSYQNIKDILDKANISIVLVCDNAILDQAFEFPRIAMAYFHKHRLEIPQLQDLFDTTISCINHRYNPLFNVVTETEESLNLFANTTSAINKINAKKVDLLKRIKDYGWRFGQYKELAGRIYTYVKDLPDVTISNAIDAIDWYDSINREFHSDFEAIKKLINDNNVKIEECYRLNDRTQLSELHRKNTDLQCVIEIPDDLRFDPFEIKLLQRKILIVNGEAGIGKTQMFATTVANILKNGYPSMLAVGTMMLTDEPFFKQIADSTGLDVSFDELLDLLEEIGERKNCVATLFIDAINESSRTPSWNIFVLTLDRKIKAYNHVKIAVSVRKGYEKILFQEPLKQKIEKQEILQIHHTGFKNHPVKSIKEFLNYYEIPFSPLDYIQYELTNPLFLKMFCKSYTSSEWDLPSLFEKYIANAEEEIQHKFGVSSGRLLHNFLDEFIPHLLKSDYNSILMRDVMQFDFWNIYGLSNQKTQFIQSVAESGIVIIIPVKDNEFCSISYNLLANYLTARHIINKFADKTELINYIKKEFLELDPYGHIRNYSAQETIGFLCGLYAEKTGEELQEIVDCITGYKADVVEDYVNSFTWRKARRIKAEDFFSIVGKYEEAADFVFKALIVNSMKAGHPLNADTLHKLLSSYSLVKRDAWWTTYINGIANEDERIYQIIQLYEKGGCFDKLPSETNRLCLLLLSWLLTASNRALRDHTSKAMIEIIKNDLSLGLYLLETFNNTNDPYVLERLYGIVFGAVVKRTAPAQAEYKKICDYVYSTIFCAEEVYPDILLRDYARLIIEKYLVDFGESSEYQKTTFRPPYNSNDIPAVSKEIYVKEETDFRGWYRINHSMIPDCSDVPGMYGDFGRYTFESALKNFENVDIANAYHFAMQHIRDTLGYDDSLLGAYDSSNFVRFDRGYGGSIERIGKKYQWITLRHILARISDNHKFKSWSDEARDYEGTWDLYVRDFDPTFNVQLDSHTEFPEIEWTTYDVSHSFIAKNSAEESITSWTESDCGFFKEHSKKLCLKSKDGQQWVVLHIHDQIDNKDSEMFHGVDPDKHGSQQIWSISNAFFVKYEDWNPLLPKLKTIDFRNDSFPEYDSENIAFYGEYPWSPTCCREGMSVWKDCVFETGEVHIETYEVPIFLKNYGAYPESNIIEREVKEEETLCQVMPAFTHLSWSAEEDYSKSEDMALYVPCAELIEHFNLHINDGNGSYSSPDGDIVCFDTKVFEGSKSIIIRKDYLDRFLKEKNYVIFWTCIGEKQFFAKKQSWSEWSGLYYFEKDQIQGDFEIKKVSKLAY